MSHRGLNCHPWDFPPRSRCVWLLVVRALSHLVSSRLLLPSDPCSCLPPVGREFWRPVLRPFIVACSALSRLPLFPARSWLQLGCRWGLSRSLIDGNIRGSREMGGGGEVLGWVYNQDITRCLSGTTYIYIAPFPSHSSPS